MNVHPWQERQEVFPYYSWKVSADDKFLVTNDSTDTAVSYATIEEALSVVLSALEQGGSINDFEIVDIHDNPLKLVLKLEAK